MSIIKNKSTQDSREFWSHVEKVAEEVESWPKWMSNATKDRRGAENLMAWIPNIRECKLCHHQVDFGDPFCEHETMEESAWLDISERRRKAAPTKG